MDLSDDDDGPGLGSTSVGLSLESTIAKERGSQNRNDNEDDNDFVSSFGKMNVVKDRRGTNFTSMSLSDDEDDEDDENGNNEKNTRLRLRRLQNQHGFKKKTSIHSRNFGSITRAFMIRGKEKDLNDTEDNDDEEESVRDDSSDAANNVKLEDDKSNNKKARRNLGRAVTKLEAVLRFKGSAKSSIVEGGGALDDSSDTVNNVREDDNSNNKKPRKKFRGAMTIPKSIHRFKTGRMSKHNRDSACSRDLAPNEERKTVMIRDKSGKLVATTIIVKRIEDDSAELYCNVEDYFADEISGLNPNLHTKYLRGGILASNDSYRRYQKQLVHLAGNFSESDDDDDDYLLSEEDDDEDEQTGAETERDNKQEEQDNDSDSDDSAFDLAKQSFNQIFLMALAKGEKSLHELGDEHENVNTLFDQIHNAIEGNDGSDEGDAAIRAPGGWKNVQEEEQEHVSPKRRESYSDGSEDFDDLYEIPMVKSTEEVDNADKRLNRCIEKMLGMEARANEMCIRGTLRGSLMRSRKSCYSKTFDVLAKDAAQEMMEDDRNTAEYCWNSTVGSASYRKNERTKRLAQQHHHSSPGISSMDCNRKTATIPGVFLPSTDCIKTAANIPEKSAATRTTAGSSFVGDDVSCQGDSIIFYEAALRYPHLFANHNEGNLYHTGVPAAAAAGQDITTMTTNQRATARTPATCLPVINDADSNAECIFDEASSLAEWMEVHDNSSPKVSDGGCINSNSDSFPDYNSKGCDNSQEGKLEEIIEESSPTSLDEAKRYDKAMKKRNIMIVDTLDRLVTEQKTEIQHLQSQRKKREDEKYNGMYHQLLLEHFEMDRVIRKLNANYIVIKERYIQALANEDVMKTKMAIIIAPRESKASYITKCVTETVTDLRQLEQNIQKLEWKEAMFGGPLDKQPNTIVIDFGKFGKNLFMN